MVWSTTAIRPDHVRPPRLAPRFADPAYRMAFARIVTHYVHHDVWLEDGSLLRGAAILVDTPGVLVHGRWDFQGPLANAWELKRAWPRADLVVVADAGHSAGQGVAEALVHATDRFAAGENR